MASSAWAEWSLLSLNDDTSLYYDRESIKSDDNGSVYAWTMWDYRDGIPSRSLVTYNEFRCEVPLKFRNLAMRIYDTPKASGDYPEKSFDTTGEWTHPAPGTLFETMALKVCGLGV